jgi:MoxR-like ATPase
MKKLVQESIKGTLRTPARQLNEGLDLGNMFNKFKRFVQKTGKYFRVILKDGVLNASIPANIATLPGNKIELLPDQFDKSINPSLGSVTADSIIAKRGSNEPIGLSRGITTYPYPFQFKGSEEAGLVNESLSNKLFEKTPDGSGELINLAWDEEESNVTTVNTRTFKEFVQLAIFAQRSQTPQFGVGKPKVKKDSEADPFEEARSLMVWGAPGIGKTQIINSIVREAINWGRVIDVQTSKMAPEDWMLPTIHNPNDDELKSFFKSAHDNAEENIDPEASNYIKKPLQNIDLPKFWLPVYLPSKNPNQAERVAEDKRNNDAANFGHGGVLFLDELSRADPMVQNTCLKLVDERTIGEYVLGSLWTIIAASNRKHDEADESVSGTGNAMNGRFNHINYVPVFEEWRDWAIKTGKVNLDILTFIEMNGKKWFYRANLMGDKDVAAPTPRTWVAASANVAILAKAAESDDPNMGNFKMLRRTQTFANLSAAVGVEVAGELMTFLELSKKWTKKMLLQIFKDPDKAQLPLKAGSSFDMSETTSLFAVIVKYSLGDYGEDNHLPTKMWENYCKYLVKLNNDALASSGLRLMIYNHPYIHTTVDGREDDGALDAEGFLETYHPGAQLFMEKYGRIISG